MSPPDLAVWAVTWVVGVAGDLGAAIAVGVVASLVAAAAAARMAQPTEAGLTARGLLVGGSLSVY